MQITGQIIVREMRERKDGKRLVAVVGILSLPDDTPIANHMQYTVAGDVRQGLPVLVIHTSDAIDRNEEANGTSFGHLLTQPIWRV
jgi:hypothetical protein